MESYKLVSPSLKTAKKKSQFDCFLENQIEKELTVDFWQIFEEDAFDHSGEKVLLLNIILADVARMIVVLENNKGVDKSSAKILTIQQKAANRGDEANGVTIWLTTQRYNRILLMIRKAANAFGDKRCGQILKR